MSEWKEVRLSEIGRIVGGATPSTKNHTYYDGEIPWITPKDLTNWKDVYISKGERSITKEGYNSASCKMMPKGSVLFTSRAPIGYIAIAANDICTNQGFKSVVPNKELVDSEFLYYVLLFNRNRIKSLGSGTTFAEISGKAMGNVVISIPELSVQKKIASQLSEIDSKIAVNRRICENLEAQAQALFKHWFIDFAPFKNGKFVESELGMIPEGWRVGTLGEICIFQNGHAFKSKEFSETGKYKLITIKGVQDGYLTTDGAVNIDNVPSNMKKHCYLKEKEILLSLTGNVGRACFVDQPNLLLNQRVAKLVPISGEYWGFVYTFIRKKSTQNIMINLAKGTAQANLSPIETSQLKIALPVIEVVSEFTDLVNSIYEKMIILKQENLRLSSMRDTLLPKLMKGEIEV